MEIVYVIIGILSVWRATYMIQEEKGPLEVFSRLQAWYWRDPVRVGGLKDGLRCFNCTSVWLSLAVTLLLPFDTLGIFILYSLSIAAGAIFTNLLYGKLK